MANQIINVGTTANDGTGDKVRDAFIKVNSNFAELYDEGGANITVNNPVTSTETTLDEALSDLNTGGGGTPTLQEVTDEGNITTNSIIFDDSVGLQTEIGTMDGGSGFYFNLLNVGNNFKQFLANADNTDERIANFPDKSGTIAFLDDITTPTLQQVTDEGNETTNRIIVIESDVSSITINNNNIERVEYDLNASTQLTFQNSENNNNIIAFPDASGTLALTSDIPSSSTFVPYTGATTNVDLGEYELKAGQLTLDTTPTGTAAVATTRWNDSLGSTETTLKGGNVILKNGVDLVARVVNKVTPNTTLTKAAYQVVRISGAQGQRLAVNLAQANNDNNSADTLGIVTETIATNQEGFIITVGQIEGINTTGSLQSETWADGDVLYLSPTTAGRMTNIKPNGSNGHIVVLGYVEHAHNTQGKIYVKIMNGWELDELHNVFIDTPLNNQALTYESSTDLWKNKTIIEDSITDGVTDKAPSQNAVFDALALKQNALGFTPYKFIQTSQTAHTGTVAETIIGTATINGGTFNSSDVMKVLFKTTKPSTIAVYNMRIRINTTNTLTGATQIGFLTVATANTYALITRTFDLQGGNLYGYNFASTLASDVLATNTVGNTTAYNTANTLYLFFTIQLGNIADSATPNLCNITN